MSNFYKLALEEFLRERNTRETLRRESDITDKERQLILARAKELERRSQLPRDKKYP
jgi:hypothetical protein